MVFALQGEVGNIAGHQHLVRAGRGCLEHGQERLAAVHPAPAQDQVGMPGESLVEEQLAPLDTGGREDVGIGDVGDPEHMIGVEVGWRTPGGRVHVIEGDLFP